MQKQSQEREGEGCNNQEEGHAILYIVCLSSLLSKADIDCPVLLSHLGKHF